MGQAPMGKKYKSPDYKLLSFFHRSRDGWKGKARRRHLRLRQLMKRVAALEDSRRKWREKAEACESRMETLRKELEEQKGGSAQPGSRAPRPGGPGRDAGGRTSVRSQTDGTVR